ncbi:MAG: glycosyltransferase family 4 protein [Oligoflexia bacterium]|nr:glycosyltransferase family 4 protein [Oligoflexia bacterium]MBF0364240.1 glycosyltransferase family 4 protein [Oligoflexia bacterium]
MNNRSVRVMYDFQIFVRQKFGGISRYFQQLIATAAVLDVDYTPLIRSYLSQNHYIREDDICRNAVLMSFLMDPKFAWAFESKFKGKLAIFSAINKLLLTPSLLFEDYDTLHPTYYDPYLLKFKGKKELVITVYDMIHEIYPQYFNRRDKSAEHKRRLLAAADKIIAISENTKRDVLRFYPQIPEQKIKVIYLGTSDFQGSADPLIKLPERYLLFVGNRDVYKNFALLLQAIAPLLQKQSDLYLVCAGGGKFNNEELFLIERLDVKDKVIHYYAGDSDLAHFYKKATCFIFPSLYEGFGIPVLESFACGCPAVLSSVSSLPEVAGDGAAYFDPKDEASIFKTVCEVVTSEKLRRELVSKGCRRLKEFSKEKMAMETLALYRS